MKKLKMKFLTLNPSQLLFIVFGLFILIGTLLLKLPVSTNGYLRWIDALFTCTSAMTVTGLSVVDTGSHFTRFGQVIIVFLIQLGGLGIMSFAMLIFIFLGKKIGLKERLLIQQSLNQVNVGGIINLVKYLFIFSISIEIIAMAFLAIRWVPMYGWNDGLYYSFFHSISAFNNAGFSIWPDNLMRFKGDPIVNLTISGLFIIGGIGFTVLIDLWKKRNWKALSLHTKMMLTSTLVVNIGAMLIIFALEYGNYKTLGSLTISEKLWSSYFQAVTTRTAGFNTLDIGSLNESTIFIMIILMFIGAGSGSTGGGIKLTTFLIIILSVKAFIKGKEDIFIFRRSLPPKYILKVLAIVMTSITIVVTAVLLLNITEKAPFINVLFEVVSAFGTVGLSMGLTASLTIFGKLIIVAVMFIGKLGPLSLAYSLTRPTPSKIKYPSEEVLIG